MKNFPYVYIVTNKFTGEFYIGYREANKLPSEQDILKYKTSSKNVKPRFDDYVPQIVAEFFTETAKDDAYWFEQELIAEHIDNPLCINRYYIKKDSRAKFKSKIGRKCSEETKLKISNSKKYIDLVSSLSNAQVSSLSSVKTRKENGSYESGAIKANETKNKNNSNYIGGKKASKTKNSIDPETGLTNAQLAGLKSSKTKNSIDPETGLTRAQKSAIKMKETKNSIDPETGLTNAQLAGQKLKVTLSSIDPTCGMTVKQRQIEKSKITKAKNKSQSKEKHPLAKIIRIFDFTGKLRYTSHGNFADVCNDNNLPFNLLASSYRNSGKPLNSNKYPEFNGWYAITY